MVVRRHFQVWVVWYAAVIISISFLLFGHTDWHAAAATTKRLQILRVVSALGSGISMALQSILSLAHVRLSSR